MIECITGKVDFCWNQGSTISHRIIWSSGATAASALPVDLTNYSARLQLRSEVSSPDIVAELTTANGLIVLGGTAGTIDLNYSAVSSAAITAAQYVYDLELVSGVPVVTRLLEGIIKVFGEVTR
tara:strand:+ start:431 stop:802 length:372 start_codon:yes stop_codon:yes gene_type:complete